MGPSPRLPAEARSPAAARLTGGNKAPSGQWPPKDRASPLHVVAARANEHDSPLLEPTLTGIVDMIGPLPQHLDGQGRFWFPNLHLDRGYDSSRTRALLEILGFEAHIAAKGQPAPIQAGKRWPVERTHSWMNGYGKLRRITDKRKVIVEFWLNLAAAFTVVRRLIARARTQYRWATRPTTRRLR
jgi:hypothetical protein